MTTRRVLVTGGAGFIGSHLVSELVKLGHRVRVLDSLNPQVHGRGAVSPSDPSRQDVEKIRGDVLDEAVLERALVDIEVVFHQAASVGVGQSMYRPADYTRVNCLGTALLMEKIAGAGSRVEKVVVASSMSIYGEGKYACPACGPQAIGLRPRKDLEAGRWEPICPRCSKPLTPLPTDEEKPLAPTSVYAITKRFQEETALVMGRAYRIPTVALRYFNVYGPGQSLSNPYTGVAAIFSSRILNRVPPLLFEDGNQTRDFIHVSDVVQANLLAMTKPEADFGIFNVGTGCRTSLLELAAGLAARLSPGEGFQPRVMGSFREGDIRHCYADIERIKTRLGYEPRVPLEQGYENLAAWARDQRPEDRLDEANDELASRGLVR